MCAFHLAAAARAALELALAESELCSSLMRFAAGPASCSAAAAAAAASCAAMNLAAAAGSSGTPGVYVNVCTKWACAAQFTLLRRLRF
jgi:hypothetical protein